MQIAKKEGDILNNQSISSFPLRRKISRQKVRRLGRGESSYRPQLQAKLCPGEPLCGLHLSLRPAPLAESKSPPRAARREAFAERLYLLLLLEEV